MSLIEFTKTLHPGDYEKLEHELAYVDRYAEELAGQGPHRRWEYAMALRVLGDSAGKGLCLDVGGAGSPFWKMARDLLGLDVRVVDPKTTFPLESCAASAPCVVCISVLEHVPDLYEFCSHLVRVTAPGGILFLTADIWNRSPYEPDTAHYHWMRQRIFTPESWQHLAVWFAAVGFSAMGLTDWTYNGDQNEHGYSFCSLTLWRGPGPKVIYPFDGKGAMDMDSQAVVRQRYNCRVCGEKLEHALNLGTLYISDFVDAPETSKHPLVPLILTRCPRCTLVQLRDTVPRDWLYSEQYWYQSGINETMVLALRDVVRSAIKFVNSEGMTVIDIGANDGTLLDQYPKELGARKHVRIGVDPAANLHGKLATHCDLMIPDYWPPRGGYDGPKAHIITAIAMFYDLDDPVEFVKEIKRALHPGGVFIIQLGDLASMLRQTAFDAICHEHLEYYSLTSISYLLESCGLNVFDVTWNATNGGSIRVFAKHANLAFPIHQRVQAMLAIEKATGVNTLRELLGFGVVVERNRTQVLEELAPFDNQTVDVYGASTKGNTLLQYYDIPGIRRAIERSPEKWGKYTVGTWLPIVSEEEGREEPAAVWLVPIWHFQNAIIRREMQFLNKGRMLFPLPTVKMIGPSNG